MSKELMNKNTASMTYSINPWAVIDSNHGTEPD